MNQFTWRRILAFTILLGLIAGVIWWPDLYNWSDHKTQAWFEGHSASLMTIDQGFNFPPTMPPDPGKEGKKTIEGIDADHDGVRDDLQRWIYALYPNEPKKRNSFRQWARGLQDFLRPDFGPEERKRNKIELSRARDCQHLTFEGEDYYKSSFEWKHLQAKVLNTYARTMRLYENQDRMSYEEKTIPIPSTQKDKNPCDAR